jgi:hypothetical protein
MASKRIMAATLLAATAVALLLGSASAQPPRAQVLAKRGHGIWLADQVSTIKSFNSSFSWWYAWDQMPYTTSPLSYGAANGKEYVPMQWTPNKVRNGTL